jgi:hypothetical protein
MYPVEESGWDIQREEGLISHHSGFKAEFRDTSIYSILEFPHDATISDIRNWVMKAENLLDPVRQVKKIR